MWAHSVNGRGERHRLEDHLRGTAELARRFGSVFGLDEVAWWAGLVHDGGKAWCDWQRRLLAVESTGGRVGLDHKSFGVQLARSAGLRPVEWVVAGHHGGLTCRSEVNRLLGDSEVEEAVLRSGRWADAERSLRRLVPELFSRVPELPADMAAGGDAMVREFLVRFLFSCLVDADALDTQAHREGGESRLGAELDAEMLWDRFVSRRTEFLRGRAAGPMSAARAQVFEAAVAAAEREPGLFRLTAPTGTAKTMAAAAFALRHAARFGKRRVIVAVPFITVTEQNAAVYRRLLDPERAVAEPVVLEHHSHIGDSDAGQEDAARWARLAAENWDAPFVVTTTVQLFESLFGRTRSQARKLHRIANSVIVLDEVQALPHRLLPPIADALRILTQRFGVSVVLSSATQPELWQVGPLQRLADAGAVGPREIVPDPPALFAGTRRVRYQWLPGRPTLAQVVRQMVAHRRALMVVNTVADARSVFQEAQRCAPAGVRVLHLSTGMCPAHRARVLTEVNTLLAPQPGHEPQPVLLVATSLIEAGVDVDFPAVLRAVAPPESQAQAAGRCNREGRLGAEGGLVVLFDPVDGGQPPSYRLQVDKARLFFGPGDEKAVPDDIAALARYFPALYSSLRLEGVGSPAASIAAHRRVWDFRAVADGPLVRGDSTARDRRLAFRMIVDDTVPVVVGYGTDSQQHELQHHLTRLRRGEANLRELRALQPFITTLYRSTARRPEVACLLEPVVGDLVEWRGGYDDGYGLVLDPRREDFIL